MDDERWAGGASILPLNIPPARAWEGRWRNVCRQHRPANGSARTGLRQRAGAFSADGRDVAVIYGAAGHSWNQTAAQRAGHGAGMVSPFFSGTRHCKHLSHSQPALPLRTRTRRAGGGLLTEHCEQTRAASSGTWWRLRLRLLRDGGRPSTKPAVTTPREHAILEDGAERRLT